MNPNKSPDNNQQAERRKTSGTLYVVATPIGNLEDITLRAIRVLSEVDLVAAEDTRHTRKLLSHLGISTPLLSYFKDKEASRAEQVIGRLMTGSDVALVSDAGTPAISDPGHILISRALAKGIKVVPIPGASAFTAALSVAGLERNSLLFLGFLPAKANQRRACLTKLARAPHHLVFYESPRRLQACLQDCLHILGDRHVFWARELTKVHEELRSAPLSQLVVELSGRQVKGESVVILHGAEQKEPEAAQDLEGLLCWYRKESGLSLKESVQRIAEDLGLPRSEIYRQALKVWGKKSD